MKSQSPQPTSSSNEDEIDPIRVELVSTELPVHQIRKRGSENIRILERNERGVIWRQWTVTGGPAGPLAYRLDTWIIKRRLNELRPPIPRLIRIGELREIARELNHGGDTNAVRKAFDQNVATFIRAKVDYRTKDGKTETLKGYFNRYIVFYRGSALPGGRRAETVYISLNDPYYDLLNKSLTRPLDFKFMRQLKPSAQRFYEIVSPKMFAAIKNGHPSAWIRYSDYCQYAVQKRQKTRSRMQSQMASVHRDHRRLKYIGSIAYEPAPTSDGSLDWIIRYEPGPRARAEYKRFNPKRGGPASTNDQNRSSEKAIAGDSPAGLAHRFAKLRHGARPDDLPTARQRAAARRIVGAAAGNPKIAEKAVDLAAHEGRQNPKGFPAHLGGVLEGGYVERALELWKRDKNQRESAARAREEQRRRDRYKELRRQQTTQRIEKLTIVDRQRVLEERLPEFQKRNKYFLSLPTWSEDRKRTWVEGRVLQEYGQEGQPSYAEWCRHHG